MSDQPNEDPELTNRKWRWRRRMALSALCGLFAFPLLVLILAASGVDAIRDYQAMINTVLFLLGSIVGAYMGLATWYEKR